MTARRYRLRLATWTVVREPGAPSPRTLSSPAAVAELARDLLREHDDDKEHFWAIYLNAQNHYLLHTLVSLGTQSASLVHPREVLGPALREGAAVTAEELLARCRDQLAKFKVPKDVTFIDALPRNPSGKVLKRELRSGADR